MTDQLPYDMSRVSCSCQFYSPRKKHVQRQARSEAVITGGGGGSKLGLGLGFKTQTFTQTFTNRS